MSKKHIATFLIVGWLIAYVLPPQRVLGFFKSGGPQG